VWLVLAAVAVIALRSGSRAGHLARPWHRDSAVLVLCMVGCAMLAFIPPAYYAGVATTRHMVGMNLATSLGLVVAAALAVSLIQQALTRPRWPAPVTARPGIGPRDPVSPAPRR
jgi:hypothetical protein